MCGQALVLDPSNWAKIVDLADQTDVRGPTATPFGLAISMLNNTNIAELHMLLRRILKGWLTLILGITRESDGVAGNFAIPCASY
jgi:hypothetical protein